jgi:hypothetical protein
MNHQQASIRTSIYTNLSLQAQQPVMSLSEEGA